MNDKQVKIGARAFVETNIIMQLSEEEARALMQIVSYGADPFVKWFYKNLGESYLKRHENGLRSLFETIQKELPKHLKKADDARDVFRGERTAIKNDLLAEFRSRPSRNTVSQIYELLNNAGTTDPSPANVAINKIRELLTPTAT